MKRKSLSVIAIITLAVVTSCNNPTTLKTSNNESEMKAVQFRIARPTNNLVDVVKFYQ